jgi:hypothetical protein
LEDGGSLDRVAILLHKLEDSLSDVGFKARVLREEVVKESRIIPSEGSQVLVVDEQSSLLSSDHFLHLVAVVLNWSVEVHILPQLGSVSIKIRIIVA